MPHLQHRSSAWDTPVGVVPQGSSYETRCSVSAQCCYCSWQENLQVGRNEGEEDPLSHLPTKYWREASVWLLQNYETRSTENTSELKLLFIKQTNFLGILSSVE